METSMPSAESSEMAEETPSRSSRGSPISSDIANPEPPKSLERKLPSKIVPSPEQDKIEKVSQHSRIREDGQEELKKAREESPHAPEESNGVNQVLVNGSACEAPGRIQVLAGELEKSKESEMRMLESLFMQTKQLEQAKIELEEAKLVIRSIRESSRGLESLGSPRSRNSKRFLENSKASDSTESQEELLKLKRELRLAVEAEEKGKTAMDSLALALRDVSTELNQVKNKLSDTQSELLKVRAEGDQSKSMLKASEDKLQLVLVEVERLRLEADESTAAWSAKEKGFMTCLKAAEEGAAKVMQENIRLLESHEAAREENSKLRDIMKQALNEANVVKGALEIARKENSQLKDVLSNKESSLKTIKQDYERVKASEAEALLSVMDLKSLLAASSTSETSRSARLVDTAPSSEPAGGMEKKQGTKRKVRGKLSSERQRDDGQGFEGEPKLPEAGSGSFRKIMSERMASLGKKADCMYGSLGCISDTTVPSVRTVGKGTDDRDHAVRGRLDGMEHGSGALMLLQQKKPVVRRFGEFVGRKLLHS